MTAGWVREWTHEGRAALFVRLMRPRPRMTLLDLGGGDGSLSARIARRVSLDVTVADIEKSVTLARERHGFRAVRLAEGARLPFEDGAYDVVLCNSVIEHVTLPKAECIFPEIAESEWVRRAAAAQARFASEIRRVGRGYFVQTPHRSFPVDAHTWLPFTNFLTHHGARRLVRVTDRFWVKKCGVADWRLLGTREIERLFPDARIHLERWAGLPKSVIAYRIEGQAAVL